MRLRLIMLAALSAMLAGCLLLPGKFESALDIRRDGRFHFHYAGEVVYLPLTEAARSQMKHGANAAAGGTAPGDQAEVFTDETCTKPDNGEARPCTPDELAAQHRAWDARKHGGSGSGASDRSANAVLAMLGGLSLTDPNAAATFADALRRQAGWRKVVSKGNGVFDVEYDIGGRLDHDFIFPTLEHTPLMVPFLGVTRRADGSVRIEAPGFAPGLGNLGAMGAMLPSGTGAKATQNPLKGLPIMDGTFAVTTDGTILTNNTEDGPAPAAGSQRLTWKINAGHGTAPSALIRLN